MAASMEEETPNMKTNSEDVILEKVVSYVNSEFGSDTSSIDRAKKLFDHVSSVKASLEKQLNFASTAVPSKIEKAVRDAETAMADIKQFSKDEENFSQEAEELIAETEPMRGNIVFLTNQIKEIERYAKYLEWLSYVDDTSSQIQSALLIDAERRSLKHFQSLVELAEQLEASSCVHLKNYIRETVLFWYNILKDRFASEFEETLKLLQWPFVISSVKVLEKGDKNIKAGHVQHKMEMLFSHLLMLQLPESYIEQDKSTMAKQYGWKCLPLPLQLMIKPLRKRFRFHFYGKKQTNNIDKPEWYLTQVLTWIRDHKDFLVNKIQPLIDRAGMATVDVVVEFCRGMVMLVMEKMQADITEMMYDEHLFSHLIDEALAFEKELTKIYEYPSNQPSCLQVLTQEKPFEKWMLLEKKFAVEKMDLILSSSSAWQCQYKESLDVEDMLVPECGESFMILMQTITDRYSMLPHPAQRLHFLDLQLELLDDFRIRLLQVMKQTTNEPVNQNFCAILNAVNYIMDVLKQWGELVIFLQLQVNRSENQVNETTDMDSSMISSLDSTKDSQLRISTSLQSISALKKSEDDQMDTLQGTVFDETINLYQHMKNDMIKNIASYISTDVKARSRPYRKDRWLTLPSQKDMGTMGLSSSACEMFMVLKHYLHTVRQQLVNSLFTQIWQIIARELNRFFYEEVILANHFNDGGANQLQFDMTRNLFPLFAEYTPRPENYFKDVKEATVLLNLKVGSAILLKDVLYQSLHVITEKEVNRKSVRPEDALNDVGVFKLSPEQAELVLSLRTDLNLQ